MSLWKDYNRNKICVSSLHGVCYVSVKGLRHPCTGFAMSVCKDYNRNAFDVSSLHGVCYVTVQGLQ